MNFKVSQLKSLSAAEVSVDDLIYIIDSNPTDGSVKSKKVTVGDLIDSRIYGINSSQFVLITGYYANPSWILSLDWSKITNAPSFVTSLSALTDVTIASLNPNQLLRYDGVAWKNWTPTYYSLPAGGTTLQYLDGTGALQTFPTSLPTSTVRHQVKAGVPITKGQAVYVTSADGTNMIVGLASNTSEATSSKTMGLLDTTVSTNGFANVVTEGLLAGLDTTGANAAGDPVWLGTNGNLIYGLTNKPYAPAHLVFIGIVTRRNANNGEIFIKPQNGFELEELHNVDARNPSNNDGIFYNSTTQLWEHKQISAIAPTSTLDQVTTAGNTTTNAITVGSVNSNGNVVIGGATSSGAFQSYNGYYAFSFGSSTSAYNPNNNYTRIHMGASITYTDNFSGNFLWRSAGASVFEVGNASVNFYNTSSTAVSRHNASTGNFLIGTTTDAGYKLDVNGTARVQSSFTGAVLKIDGTGAATGFEINSQLDNDLRPSYIVFSRGGTQKYIVGHSYGRSGFFISNGNDTVTYLNINSTGNILIGTTTDAGYKLDVNGTARIQGNATVTGSASSFSLDANNRRGVVIGSAAALGSVELRGDTIYSGFVTFSRNTTGEANFGINYVSGASALKISNTLTSPFYITTPSTTVFDGSITASSSLARGLLVSNTLVAAANNDVLVGLDINPTFTNGAFTGVSNYALRLGNNQNMLLQGEGMIYHNSGSSRILAGRDAAAVYFGYNFGTQQIHIGSAGSGNILFRSSGNVCLENANSNLLVGTTTDAGYKLDVNGNTIIRGGTLNLVGNYLGISGTCADVNIFNNCGSGGSIGFTLGGNRFFNIWQVTGSSSGNTSGTHSTLSSSPTYAWSSGNAISNHLLLAPTINNTGTYSGIFRGFYYNPTLTSLTGTTHRAIETTSGDILFSGNGPRLIFQETTATINTAATTSILFGSSTTSGYGAGIFGVASQGYNRTNIVIASGGTTDTSNVSTANANFVASPDITQIYKSTILNANSFTYRTLTGNTGTLSMYWSHAETKVALFSNSLGAYGLGDFRIALLNTYDSTTVSTTHTRFMVTGDTYNVLIGTTTDSGYKLDVNGTTRLQDHLLFSSGKGIYASSASNTVLQSSLNYFTHNRLASSGTLGFQIAVVGNVQSFWRYNDGTGDVEFGNANGSYHLGLYAGNTERVKILGSGNVGIGTTTPAYKLDVVGDVRFQKSNGANLYLSETGGNAGDVSGLYLTGNNSVWGGSIRYNVGPGGATNRLDFYHSLTGLGFSLISTGNVAIGTTTDNGYKLQVNGNAFIKGSGSTSATTSLLVQNSNGLGNFQILDDSSVQVINEGKFSVNRYGNTLLTTGQAVSTLATYNSYITIDNNFITLWRSSTNYINLRSTYTEAYAPLITFTSYKAIDNSAQLEVHSTTRGFLPPRLTTAQILLIASPAEGLQVYNTDLKTICFYNGTAWQRVTSSAM